MSDSNIFEFNTDAEVRAVDAFTAAINRADAAVNKLSKENLDNLSKAVKDLKASGNKELDQTAQNLAASAEKLQKMMNTTGKVPSSFVSELRSAQAELKSVLQDTGRTLSAFNREVEQHKRLIDNGASAALKAAREQARVDKELLTDQIKSIKDVGAAWKQLQQIRQSSESRDLAAASVGPTRAEYLAGSAKAAAEAAKQESARLKAEAEEARRIQQQSYSILFAQAEQFYKDRQRLADVYGRAGNLALKDDSLRSLTADTKAQAAALAAQQASVVEQTRAYYQKLEQVGVLKDTIRNRIATGNVGVTSASPRMDFDQKEASYRTSMDAMKAYYESQQTVVDKLRDSHANLSSTIGKGVAPAGQLNNALKQFTIDGDVAHSTARGLASAFGLLWLTWGNLVPLFAGAGISYAVKKTFDIGSEVEYNIKFMEQLGLVSKEASGTVREALRQIDQDTMFSVRELSAAMVDFGQSGYSMSDSLKMVRASADLAAAGMVDLKTASRTLTQVNELFGLSADDAAKTASKLFTVTKASSLNVENLAGSMKYASTVNVQYGKSLEEVLALFGALSKAGIKDSMAGTAVANFMQDLSVRSGTAAKAVAQLEKSLNSVKEKGAKDWKFTMFNADGTQKTAISAITELSNAMNKLKPEAANKFIQSLTTERGIRVFFSAIREGLPDLQNMVETLQNVKGDEVFKAAKGMMDTTKGALEMLKSSLEGALDKVFDTNSQAFKTFMLDMKRVFDSPEFLATVQGIVQGVGALYDSLKTLYPVMEKVGYVWLGWKALTTGVAIFQSLGLAVAGFTATLAMSGATSVKAAAQVALYGRTASITGAEIVGATVATRAAAAGMEVAAAQTAGAAAKAAAASGAFGMLARVAGFLANPLVGAAVTVGTLAYSFFSLRDAAKSGLSETSAEVLSSTNTNIANYQREISKIVELRNLQGSGDIFSSAQKGLDATVSELRDAELKLANFDDKLVKRAANGLSSSQRLADERTKLEENVLRLRSDRDSKARVLDRARTEVEVSELNKRLDAERKAAAEKARLEGQLGFAKNGTGKNSFGSEAVKSYSDTFAKINRLQTAELETTKQVYNDQLATLEAYHRAALVSQGEYQVKKLQLAAEADAKSLGTLERSKQAIEEKFKLEQTALKKGKGYEANLKALEEERANRLAALGETEARIHSERAKRSTEVAMATSIEAAAATKAFEKWNTQEQIKLAAEERAQDAREKAALAGPEEVARIEARIKAESRFEQQIATVQAAVESNADSYKAMADAIKESGDEFDVAALSYLASWKSLEALLERIKKLAKEAGTTAGDAAADKARADKQKKFLEAQAKEYEDMVKKVGDDLFLAIRTGGKQGTDSLKQMLTDALLSPFKIILQPVLQGVGGLVASVLLPQGAAASAAGYGTSALTSAGGSALGSSLFGGASLSSLGTAFGEGFMATLTGSSISGGTAAGLLAGGAAPGTGLAGTLGAAAPYAIAAAAVLSAVGAFRKTKQVGSGLTGTLGSGDIENYALMRKSGYLFGGPDYSIQNKGVSEQSASLQKSFETMRTAAAQMATNLGLSAEGVKNFTVRLGSDLIHPDTGQYGLKLEGLSAEEAQKKVAEALESANNELAQRILGEWTTTSKEVTKVITTEAGHWESELQAATQTVTETITESTYKASDLAKEGETASQTLTRLATDLATVNTAFDTLGATLLTGLAGADQASKLIAAFGGQDAFNSSASAYYEAFFTEEEKRATLTRQVTAALAAQNYELPTTLQGFRDLVEAQDLTTEAGQATVAALLKVAPSFKKLLDDVKTSVDQAATAYNVSTYTYEAAGEGAVQTATDYADALKSVQDAEKAAKQQSITLLQGEKAAKDAARAEELARLTAIQAVEAARLTSLGQLTEASQLSLVVDQQRVWALEDQNAIQTERNSLEERWRALTETSSEAFERQVTAVNESNQALARQVAMAERFKALTEGLDGLASQFMDEGAFAAYKYTMMANKLKAAGLPGELQDIADWLSKATKEQFVEAAKSIFNMGESTIGLQEAIVAIGGDFASLKDTATSAAQAIEDAFKDAGKSIVDYIRELATGEAGLATPGELLARSRATYQSDLAAAQGGSSEAASRLAASAQAYIEAQKGYSASSDITQTVVSTVLSQLGGLSFASSQMDDATRTALSLYLQSLTGVQQFASGGAFTNGIVTRPTMFNMAQMGEAGAEAIFPLTNIGGDLGVRATTDPALAEMLAEIKEELRQMREQQAQIGGAVVSATLSTGDKVASATSDAVSSATWANNSRPDLE